MREIKTVEDIKNAIQQLESKQADELLLLKGQFLTTYESLKPINIINDTFKKLANSSSVSKSIINTAIGVSAGVIIKKIVLGNTYNLFSKLLGGVLEYTIANKVTKNADQIKSFASTIINQFVRSKPDSPKVS